MNPFLGRVMRVAAICLLGGCASPQCDPTELRAQCASERAGVADGLLGSAPTCHTLDSILSDSRNEDLSNQGSGGTPGGGTGGGTPGGE